MSGLTNILNKVRSVLNGVSGLQPSTVVFDADYLPDTVRHKSYQLAVGSIQNNRTSQGGGSGVLCSDKNRLLSVLLAAKSPHRDQKDYEDLILLEELIEDRILKDSRTASYFNSLQNVETVPGPNGDFWVMEMVFDFDYQRIF